MKQFSDDDIEVLGIRYSQACRSEPTEESPRPAPRRKRWPWLVVLLVAVVALCWLLHRVVFLAPVEPDEDDFASPLYELMQPSDSVQCPVEDELKDLEMLCDTINDVPFVYCSLASLRASLSLQFPDTLDASVMLVVPAADVRRDNDAIVGDFVLEGKLLSRGERKPGYLYAAPDGQWRVGIDAASDAVRRAQAEGGSLFRQYALVMEGEVQENLLRGKAVRRAVGFVKGTPVFVMSRERESVYDFSQALADYGFSHALYLPGSCTQMYARTSQLETSFYPELAYLNSSYLIFRR